MISRLRPYSGLSLTGRILWVCSPPAHPSVEHSLHAHLGFSRTMRIRRLATAAAAFPGLVNTAPVTPQQPGVRTVWKSDTKTWLENLAVRADGSILTTTMYPGAIVRSFDPFSTHAEPKVIATIPNANVTMGIVEVSPDQFAVVAGNWSVDYLSPESGSWSIWLLDLTRGRVDKPGAVTTPRLKHIADVKEAGWLNGLTILDATSILAADCLDGGIYRINIETGKYAKVQADASMASSADLPVGINGLRLHGPSTLWFSNTVQGSFTTVRIHPDGTAAGPYTSTKLGQMPDDFAFDNMGNVYLATNLDNSLVMIDQTGTIIDLLGPPNSTILEGVTSAKFGRTPEDHRVLYMTTNGGIAKPLSSVPQGGRLVAIDVDKLEPRKSNEVSA